MDTEAVSFEEFRACLEDLAWVNSLTFAHAATLRFLERVVAKHGLRAGSRPLVVLDVGSGYGDALRAVAAWAKQRNLAVSLTGVDLNPWSRKAADEATVYEPGIDLRWVTADAFTFEPEGRVDVVMSSLFTHHLTDEGIVSFLRWMESRSKLGWFVSDLHRHALPYHFFRWFSKATRLHRFVQHDGPVSIARAFEDHEWRSFLNDAGLSNVEVDVAWSIPFRWTLARVKEP